MVAQGAQAQDRDSGDGVGTDAARPGATLVVRVADPDDRFPGLLSLVATWEPPA
ncbi:hypothetical protein [Nocardia carnea]|uniref:hypothetical protein n=1 Tax=Nocardia carnea TaxID=37328 RepID=UPI00245425FA|nr:hypothetical protein [Nocardia carnea]